MHLQVDKGLKQYFQAQTSLGPSDVFISSTAFCFRNRLRLTGLQQVKFPFLSLKLKPGGIHKPDSTWVQNFYNTHGRWIEDMNNPNSQTGKSGDRVKVYPYYADYECIFWCNEYAKAVDMFQRVYKSNWDDNLFEYAYIINGEEYLWDGLIEFTNLELDPEFQEQDELIRNKLHSVSLDFQVKAFIFEGMGVQQADGAEINMFYGDDVRETAPDETFMYLEDTNKMEKQ